MVVSYCIFKLMPGSFIQTAKYDFSSHQLINIQYKRYKKFSLLLQTACAPNLKQGCNGLGLSDAHVEGKPDFSGEQLSLSFSIIVIQSHCFFSGPILFAEFAQIVEKKRF